MMRAFIIACLDSLCPHRLRRLCKRAVTPDGKYVYVGNTDVSVIDTATNMVVATVPFAFIDGGIANTPDGKRAYGAGGCTGGLACFVVIDTATNTVVAEVEVGGTHGSFGIAITPDGKHAYAYVTAHSLMSSHVSVINTATNTVVAEVGFPFRTRLCDSNHPGWETRLCHGQQRHE